MAILLPQSVQRMCNSTLPPLVLDPGAVVADKGNLNSPAVKPLLNPPTAKAS